MRREGLYFIRFYNFTYLFLAVPGLPCFKDFSLVAVSRALIAVVFLVGKHRL